MAMIVCKKKQNFASEYTVMAPHALLVEDNSPRAHRIQSELRSYGVSVEVTPGKQIHPAAALSHLPDVIIMSTDLTDTNSFTLCQMLKTEAATADIPVIMLACYNQSEAVMAAFRVGARDYILHDTFLMHNLVASLRQMHIL